jgi:MoaA/NifB/PqqE/SkfB family radical SAM enzyme
VKHRFPAIYFEATRLCNLSCPICMTSSNDEECVRKSRGRELSFREIRDLVLVPAKRLGTVAVGWSGGEFLLRQDALDLLRLTAELGYRCNVCSNCKLLDRSLLEEMKEAAGGKLTISVGINSIDERNQWTRDTEADHSLEVLEICRELGIDRHVIITIGKHNTESFERTVDYLVERRISYNRSPLVARGSGVDHFEAMAFDRHDLKESFHPALRRSVNGYVSYTPFFLSPELYEQVSGARVEGRVPQNPPIGCWAGTWLTINAEGDVSVCPVLLDELNGGNVREKPLDELRRHDPRGRVHPRRRWQSSYARGSPCNRSAGRLTPARRGVRYRRIRTGARGTYAASDADAWDDSHPDADTSTPRGGARPDGQQQAWKPADRPGRPEQDPEAVGEGPHTRRM